MKNRPSWADSQDKYKEKIRGFYRQEVLEKKFLSGGKYDHAEEKQLYRMTHLEVFHFDILGDFSKANMAVLFDYEKRNVLTHEANTMKVIL